MSVTQRLATFPLLRRLVATDEEDGLQQLQEYLELQQRHRPRLEAVYRRPRIDYQGEPTAVFPYELVNSDGDYYASGAKEFPIPNDGLNDPDAPLTNFTEAHSISTVADLETIIGQRDPVTINDHGDLVVGA